MMEFKVITTVPDDPKKLFRPFCRVVIDSFSCDEDGRISITPDLVNYQEIDGHFDLVISQFEQARSSAKRRLAKAIRQHDELLAHPRNS